MLQFASMSWSSLLGLWLITVRNTPNFAPSAAILASMSLLNRPPPSSGGGLYYDGVSHAVGELQGLGVVFDSAVGARHDGNRHFLRKLAGRHLVAEHSHRLDGRTDERYATIPAYLGEVDIFRQKAVTGMNRLDVGNLGSAYDTRDIQIALGALSRADTYRLVGELQVRSASVGLGVNGHRLDAKLVTGPDYSKGYFTTVCYKDS